MRCSGCSSPGCWCASDFPGKRVVSALVDLPFALPTAVAGIALTALYAPNGWVGQLSRPLGHQGRLSRRSGVVVALIFIGLPFVVRSVEPVLADLGAGGRGSGRDAGRQAAADLSPRDPARVCPALLTGFALAFARGVGEYGSVIFIAGNMPYQVGDRAAADRHPARAIRLCRRDRDRGGDAARLLRAAPVINLIQAWAATPERSTDAQLAPHPRRPVWPLRPARGRARLPRPVPAAAAGRGVRRGAAPAASAPISTRSSIPTRSPRSG